MNTRALFTALTLTFLVLFSACQKKEETPITPSLTLTASKKVVIADGKDKATFTVIDQEGKDVTSSCTFTANSKDLLDNTFSSATIGDFEIIAKNAAGTKSNAVKIKAISEKANFEIRATKSAIVADGGDLINVTLWDVDNDVELADGARFFLDGKPIDGKMIRLTEKGNHKVTAMWNGKEAKKPLTISGVELRSITGRALIETLTSTTCRYCHNEIKAIDGIEEKTDRAAVIAIHDSSSTVYHQVLDEEGRAHVTSFIQHIAKGETGTPNSFVSRGPKKEKIGNIGADVFVSQRIPTNADVAISIDTKVEGNKIKVKAFATGKNNIEGKIVAALVENGHTAAQVNMGVIEMRQVLRAYAPSVNGADITIEAGKAKAFNAEFNISTAKIENCKVIVFVQEVDGMVKNVQHVKVGEAIGY